MDKIFEHPLGNNGPFITRTEINANEFVEKYRKWMRDEPLSYLTLHLSGSKYLHFSIHHVNHDYRFYIELANNRTMRPIYQMNMPHYRFQEHYNLSRPTGKWIFSETDVSPRFDDILWDKIKEWSILD